MKYKIVDRRTTNELSEEVNRLIESGWEPIGGMTIEYKTDMYDQIGVRNYYQTMVQRNNEVFYGHK